MSDLAYTRQFGNQQVAFFPQVQVRADALILFETSDPPPRRGDMSNFQGAKAYAGTVTPHTAKRIRSALDVLLQKSPERRILNPITNTEHDFRISFATLTISSGQLLSASEAYEKLLSKYLRYLKEKAGMKRYIWKAELQQRKQVHYHIVTDTFIDYRTCRWKWNALQKQAGLLKEYALKHKNYNPNSTDIHSVRGIGDLGRYIGKYLCKNTQNQTATAGKVWDCSAELKVKRFTTDLDSTTRDLIEKQISRGNAERIYLDNCTVIKIKNASLYLSKQIRVNYQAWKQ